MRISIIGGSGYTGGELIRLLLRHPEVEINQVTSQRFNGKNLSSVHPNLRKITDLKFSSIEKLENCDILFLSTPNGYSMNNIKKFLEIGTKVVDLSSDFRLKNPKDYEIWYNHVHTAPEILEKAVYGLPELHRKEIKKANLISGVGCIATSAILPLYPLIKNNLIDLEKIIVDSKIGSSARGNQSSLSSHHPERSGVVRIYAPTMHRHTAEIEQELNFGIKPTISLSAHGVEIVRGILSTCHVFLKDELIEKFDDKEIWKIYRNEYRNEQFIRIVKERKGIYRFPEPKLLIGSNFCDIGFVKDEHSNRVVIVSAIDNLMKGAAGSAVQCMNIMSNYDETLGLEDFGFHPI